MIPRRYNRHTSSICKDNSLRHTQRSQRVWLLVVGTGIKVMESSHRYDVPNDHYLLNHMVLMCSRKEEEAALGGTEPVLVDNGAASMADEPVLDMVVGS